MKAAIWNWVPLVVDPLGSVTHRPAAALSTLVIHRGDRGALREWLSEIYEHGSDASYFDLKNPGDG